MKQKFSPIVAAKSREISSIAQMAHFIFRFNSPVANRLRGFP